MDILNESNQFERKRYIPDNKTWIIENKQNLNNIMEHKEYVKTFSTWLNEQKQVEVKEKLEEAEAEDETLEKEAIITETKGEDENLQTEPKKEFLAKEK